MSRKNNRGFSGILRTIVLIAAIAVFVFSAYRLYSIYRVYKMSGDEYRELSGSFTRPKGTDRQTSGAAESAAEITVSEAEESPGPEQKSRLSIRRGTEESGAQDVSEATDGISSAEAVSSLSRAEENNAREGSDAAVSENTLSGPAGPDSPVSETNVSDSQTSDLSAASEPAASSAAEALTEDDASSAAEEVSSDREKNKTEKEKENGKHYEDAEPPLEVDWKELRSINPDIVGWIYVDGLPNINYPICRGEDNDYYLHHTFRREYLFAGSVFEDFHNAADFSDPNTIVYGHNMRDGSMFNKLKELLDQEKYEKNPYFWILTPKGNYRYHIFCITKAGVGSDVYLLYEQNGEEFLEWEKKIRGMSDVTNDVELDKDDKVVVLSTCTSDSSVRCVVIGKCVSSDHPIKPTPIPTPPPPPPPRFRFLPRKADEVMIFDEDDNYPEDEITDYDYADDEADTDIYFGETYDDTEYIGDVGMEDDGIVLE